MIATLVEEWSLDFGCAGEADGWRVGRVAFAAARVRAESRMAMAGKSRFTGNWRQSWSGSQQRVCGPEEGCLPVKIAVGAGAVEIVIAGKALVSADADIADVTIRIHEFY